MPDNGRFRSLDRLIIVAIAVIVLSTGGSLLAGLSVERTTFLGIGMSAFFLALVVGRYGIVAYHHETGSEPKVTESPVPPALLWPVLVIVGVLFVLAATPTPVGDFLGGAASGSILLYDLVAAVYNLVLAAVFAAVIIGCLIGGIWQRDGELFLGGAMITGFLGFVGLVIYGLYRLNPGYYEDAWDEYVEPFRFAAGLFT